jgi:hypothetical protein
MALGTGTFAFVMDWVGYDRFNVDLFVPRAFSDVWWHWPLWVGLCFGGLMVYRGDDDGPRGLGL